MKKTIALFRGINVGGRNVLPMAKLRRELETLGLENVRTYIQSGNVVFDTASQADEVLAEEIRDRIETGYGFRPHLLLLGQDDLQAAIENNPFPEAISDPKTLHFYFLAEPAVNADLTAIEAAKAATEEYQLTDRVFYLHAPDGIGRSKLAANVEKHLSVVTTARNYRTVGKLWVMIDG